MNTYDKVKLTRLINDENGTNYHRNIPLDGYVITLGDSFISFAFKEVSDKTIAVIHYIYVTNKAHFISLLGYCINLWSGYGVKMLYYREHRRKSNIVKTLTHLGFDVKPITKNNWKHDWISTNGFSENDCIEAYTKVAN